MIDGSIVEPPWRISSAIGAFNLWRVTYMIGTILLVFAFVLAVLAAFNFGQPRWSLGWASLACYFLSLLLGGLHLGGYR